MAAARFFDADVDEQLHKLNNAHKIDAVSSYKGVSKVGRMSDAISCKASKPLTLDKHNSMSVSYTHLTLPTNREV